MILWTHLSMERDFDRSTTKAHDIRLSEVLTLRVYSDTSPRNWKIADLQKGPFIVYKGIEAVGEGTGFGSPILIYSDETYFAGTSKVRLFERKDPVIVKEFHMDRVLRERFRNVKLENRRARTLIRQISASYQRHEQLRFLTVKSLTARIGIHPVFVDAASVGKVVVAYTVKKSRIKVRADFRHLRREGLCRIFMLNEHGNRHFRKYVDADGIELLDGEIGAWDDVNANWACITDLDGELGFRLYKMQGCVLRRGREFLNGCLDWVGLDYELSSKQTVFEYEIDVVGT